MLGTPRIRDIAWRTPGSVAVLAGPTEGTSQVLIVKVDGSSTPEDLTTDAELFRDQAVRLVTSPATGHAAVHPHPDRADVLAGRQRPLDRDEHRAGAGRPRPSSARDG